MKPHLMLYSLVSLSASISARTHRPKLVVDNQTTCSGQRFVIFANHFLPSCSLQMICQKSAPKLFGRGWSANPNQNVNLRKNAKTPYGKAELPQIFTESSEPHAACTQIQASGNDRITSKMAACLICSNGYTCGENVPNDFDGTSKALLPSDYVQNHQ